MAAIGCSRFRLRKAPRAALTVRGGGHSFSVAIKREISGRDLRYLLTHHLLDGARPASIRELVGVVDRAGFVLVGRPSKAVSDALRRDVTMGRVVRLSRGWYGPGRMPKQTRSWRRQAVQAFRNGPLG